ncbi:MAG: hypothetical protein V3W41_08390 [Planctomycetota bacterium]
MYDDEFDLEAHWADCHGCDSFIPVDEVGLCRDCSVKLERDLLRQRDWVYSSCCYGVPNDKREELRLSVIKKHGAALELLAPDPKTAAGKDRKRQRQKRKPQQKKNR